jgi:hypothetical protein
MVSSLAVFGVMIQAGRSSISISAELKKASNATIRFGYIELPRSVDYEVPPWDEK